jgi:prepilin-type N-terminal cleavage/methylation domain-containing protein
MKKNAFTVLELLIVIAIIGIISVIVVISINPKERIQSAKYARIISEMVSLDKAFQLVYLDELRTH